MGARVQSNGGQLGGSLIRSVRRYFSIMHCLFVGGKSLYDMPVCSFLCFVSYLVSLMLLCFCVFPYSFSMGSGPSVDYMYEGYTVAERFEYIEFRVTRIFHKFLVSFLMDTKPDPWRAERASFLGSYIFLDWTMSLSDS